jgi:CheY-like chemotaxis protein
MQRAITSILLVDDNPIDIDLALRAFQRCNAYNPIQVARNADEVAALMSRWEAGEPPPVLILLDLHLPKVSGLEILRQLKSHTQAKTIPVIMLTSSAEEENVRAAYELGVNSYVVKPVDFGKFLELTSQIEGYWCGINTTPR